ncbi:unknown [Prevotella sp. CAG:487]|nr:unknown [Prevotella sp. CAG:487]
MSVTVDRACERLAAYSDAREADAGEVDVLSELIVAVEVLVDVDELLSRRYRGEVALPADVYREGVAAGHSQFVCHVGSRSNLQYHIAASDELCVLVACIEVVLIDACYVAALYYLYVKRLTQRAVYASQVDELHSAYIEYRLVLRHVVDDRRKRSVHPLQDRIHLAFGALEELPCVLEIPSQSVLVEALRPCVGGRHVCSVYAGCVVHVLHRTCVCGCRAAEG